jgi:hypothetical protein
MGRSFMALHPMLANRVEAGIESSPPSETGIFATRGNPHEREFQLLTRSALWPRWPADRDSVRILAQEDIEWNVFLDMVELHRLSPIIFHNLAEYAKDVVPPTILLRLERETAAKGLAALQNLSEILRLQKLFSEAAIDLRILKGIPLAILAYGNPGLRESGDIDLLIEEGDIAAAHDLLGHEGYVRTEPDVEMTPRRFSYYVAHWKDFVYYQPTTGHSVELHWRLTRNRAMPGALPANPQSSSWIDSGSARIHCLSFDDLFLYLCVHGALDGWMRLKSLADIVSLCRNMPASELDRLVELANRAGVLPEVSAALLLANRVFGVNIVSSGMLPASNGTVKHILKFSWFAISSNDYRLRRDEISGQQWVGYELGLRTGGYYRWQVLQRVFFRTRVWSAINLPDSLFLLYPVISPFEWLLFHSPWMKERREN